MITPAQWKDVVNITPLSRCRRRVSLSLSLSLSLAGVAILMGVLLRNQLQNLNKNKYCGVDVLEHNLTLYFSIWCGCKRLPENEQNNPQNQ